MLTVVTTERFDYDEASLEAQNARATAIDLVATWLGGDALETGEHRDKFMRDEFFEKVVSMDWRETAHVVVALAFISSILARTAAQLPLALDELDTDPDDFAAEHGAGDPIGYLRGIELAVGQFLRGELDDD